MSNSPLVTYTNITKNRTSPREAEIDTITIHCYVGQVTAKQGCDYFATTDRQASSNYVVGYDGSIGLSVPEADRSWCSSNWQNDKRAITIEMACEPVHPYEVTDAAFNALIDLLVDVCQRNNIPRLLWKADKSLIGKIEQQNMTVHRWFDAKSCPGEHLYNRHYEIAEKVNARLASGDTSNPKQVWDYFMSKIGNEYGVAGLMGNLQAESGLYPDRVQGDVPYSSYSQEYTAKVDSGEISSYDFVNNGPGGGGYGLAQWTYPARKQALYDLYKSGGYPSIGSMRLACDYLWHELQTEFSGVLAVLQTATSVREASDAVLHDFERPADQSALVEQVREKNGLAWYNRFSGSAPGGGDPYNPLKRKKIGLLLMWAATGRK